MDTLKRGLLIAAFLILLPMIFGQQAQDSRDDGYTLLHDLTVMNKSAVVSQEDTNHAFFALGYVLGVSELVYGMSKDKTFAYDIISDICMPTSQVHLGEMKSVVVKYLSDHPERLHYSRIGATAAALKAAFPCEKK